MSASSSTVRTLKLDQAPWIVLYALTLAAQWFAAVARWILLYIALELVKLVTGWPIPSNPIALAFAFAPLAVSLLSVLCPPLIAPLDGRWWEITSGGRPPEDDEREAFDRALRELQDVDPNLRGPRHWFVAEAPGSNAAAYAASMQVERGLLESPYAAAPHPRRADALNYSPPRPGRHPRANARTTSERIRPTPPATRSKRSMRTLTATRAPRDICPPRTRGLAATPRRIAVDLTPQAVEQIATRLSQLLAQQRPPKLMTGGELARYLRVERAWVYKHRQLLGGERIGTGPKAPWRFDRDTALRAFQQAPAQQDLKATAPDRTTNHQEEQT